MDIEAFKERGFDNEFVFAASRSGGPGGQNVNKVNSKVELRFNIPNSLVLSDDEKGVLLQKLQSKITTDGELLIVCQTDRSQLKNKQMAVLRFYRLLFVALMPEKPRKPTKPTFASRLKRLDNKRVNSQKKTTRKPPRSFD